MQAPLIDIGANLGHESFDHDLPQVLQRAQEAGLVHIMVTGTSIASTRKAIELASRYPSLSATAGIHPHEAHSCTADTFTELEALVTHESICAVGETGLDFNRNYSPHPDQEKVFIRQLELACTTGKPVFLHQRDAHERFFPILREYRDALKAGGVVHCFTGIREEMYDYLDMDMHVGITGWICDERRGRHLLPLVKDIPPDRLLLETDAPYLLPRTLRPKPSSRRNEPAWLTAVLATVAEAAGRPVEMIARETTENARRLFDLQEAGTIL